MEDFQSHDARLETGVALYGVDPSGIRTYAYGDTFVYRACAMQD